MAKKDINTSKLNAQQFRELVGVQKDIFFFSTFANVVHPIRGKTQFLLYPYQKSVLYNFLKHRFNIILKFRQAGVTELIALYCLWLASYQPNKKINIISIKDIVAKKVLKKIKYMYKNLPEHLQVPIINGRTGELGTSSVIEFENGSFIESIPTSEEAGRSESLTLLVIDEAAIVRWASSIWAASFPTLSTGGSAILNSTPFGIGNFYHSKWVEALTDRDSPFNPIRLHWEMHPERDQNWYNSMSKALGPKRTAQEIDGDFLSSGSTVFDLSDIKAIEDTLSEYPLLETRFNGQLRIYNRPKRDTQYFLGADVATGRASDYSAFTLGDSSGEEASVFKGRIPVDKFATILGNVGREFNWAMLAPETNDIGLAVTTMLQNEGYPNLYHYKKLLKKKGKAKPTVEEYPGWMTSSKNRTLIIDGLEEDVRKDNMIIKDPFFTQEAYTFIYDSMGRPVAMGKHNRNNQSDDSGLELEGATYSDDSIMGKAIYNHVRKNHTTNLVIPPV